MKTGKENTQRGQSLVEFAISAVILILLLVALVDGARVFFTYMALRDAAQEGALYGSLVPGDMVGIRARVRGASEMVNGYGLADGQIQITFPDGGTNCNGKGIRLQVTYPNFPLTMPFLGAIIGSQTIPISATVTDTILLPPCT